MLHAVLGNFCDILSTVNNLKFTSCLAGPSLAVDVVEPGGGLLVVGGGNIRAASLPSHRLSELFATHAH